MYGAALAALTLDIRCYAHFSVSHLSGRGASSKSKEQSRRLVSRSKMAYGDEFVVFEKSREHERRRRDGKMMKSKSRDRQAVKPPLATEEPSVSPKRRRTTTETKERVRKADKWESRDSADRRRVARDALHLSSTDPQPLSRPQRRNWTTGE
ncbi:hypothetical protein IWX90DRAFT_482148 [Phyllosticta citrichinensis]|uniref:Uncharacterized protein n=1 Tax=Phyllosticta citrichinensis TaxID=1130410 RepID=A0ABR1Y5V7_9PEZI